jgi:hypothetical protein
MLLSITFRTIRHSSRRIVFHAVRRDDFLVGQAVSPVTAPAVSGILEARLLSGAANLILAAAGFQPALRVVHLSSYFADTTLADNGI